MFFNGLTNDGVGGVGLGGLEVKVDLIDFIASEGKDWDGGEFRGD